MGADALSSRWRRKEGIQLEERGGSLGGGERRGPRSAGEVSIPEGGKQTQTKARPYLDPALSHWVVMSDGIIVSTSRLGPPSVSEFYSPLVPGASVGLDR